MRKRIAVMGTDGGVSFSAERFDNALNRIGQNTGNALFQYALWKRVGNPKFLTLPHVDPSMVKDNADILLIPAANQVNPHWDLGSWADFVEAVDLPCVMIGLGAQSDIDGDPRLQLQPGTERYIRSVAERSKVIGLRGEFTKKVLENMGIFNTEVTGCPSQTISNSITGKSIAEQLDATKNKDVLRVAHVWGTFEEHIREKERLLGAMVSQHETSIVLQTHAQLLEFVHTHAIKEEDGNFLRWVGSIVHPNLSPDEFLQFLANRATFYSDARTWIDSMRRYDLAIGMRIHGAVAAIQGGSLGICVAFDSRTLELAHTMGYPYVKAGNIEAGMSLHDILEMVEFDVPRFDHLRVVNARKIDCILQDAGIE